MHILLFHPVVLPPQDYGGVERVVLWLAKGLVARGHRVSIAALKGSLLPEKCSLVETRKKKYSHEDFSELLPKDVDLVHFMAPLDEETWDQLSFPRILTVHGNGSPGERFPKNTVFLSQNHAQRHGGNEFVYNGIDPDEYLYEPELKEDFYLFLSKTSWKVKNLAGAMSYCEKARVALKIAGGNRPFNLRLKSWVQPKFQWQGPVAGKEKAFLLSRAKALIFPVEWPEPFGLVVAEALLSGTPVIASPRGSLMELIPKEVGALPKSQSEWVRQLETGVKSFDPATCRKWAMERFHFLIMAEKYEGIYQRVLRGETLHHVHPVSGDWRKE